MLMSPNDVVYEGKWFFNSSASLRSSGRASRVRQSVPRFESRPAPAIEIVLLMCIFEERYSHTPPLNYSSLVTEFT